MMSFQQQNQQITGKSNSKNMTTKRPSRGGNGSRTKKKVPSSSYYLGYVEDDESIESIMQKFEEMEKLKSNHHLSECNSSSSSSSAAAVASSSSSSPSKSTAASNKNGKQPWLETVNNNEEDSYLDEELQEELFKRTSQSNIYSEIMSSYNNGGERKDAMMDEMEDDEQVSNNQSDYSSSDEDYVDDNIQDGGESDDGGSNEEEEDENLNSEQLVDKDEEFSNDEEEANLLHTDDEEENRAKKKRKPASSRSLMTKRSSQKRGGDNTIKDLITLDPNMNFLNSFEGNSTSGGTGGSSSNSKKSRATSNIEIVNIPTAEKILNSWAKHIQRATPKECKKHKVYSECQTIDLTNFEENFTKLTVNRTNSKKSSSSFVSTVYTFDTEEDVIITNRVLDYNFKSICKNQQPFEGILIDPPYHSIQVKELKKLPLDKKWFMERGYCFVWIEKEYTVEVVKIMKGFDFEYVDSLTWVKETIHQRSSTLPSQLFNKGKLNLFIFRKMNDLTKSMHIKHQRNADVVLDFAKDNSRHRPPVIFHMIETLLSSSDRFLELWGEGCYQHCKFKTCSKWTVIKEESSSSLSSPSLSEED